MSLAMQKQIRDNAKSIQNSLDDLYHWSEGMSMSEKAKKGDVPKKGPTKYAKVDKQKDNKKEKKEQKSVVSGDSAKDAALVRDKTSIAQFYRDWDKFDVDGEVDKIEAADPQPERKIDIEKYKTQARTTTAKPNVKVAVRSNNRAVSNLEFSNAKKEEGGRLFAKSRFKEAEAAYRCALTYLDGQRSDECVKGSVILRSNIAACLIKHNDHTGAIAECTFALDLDPSHVKSLFRRGTSYSRLGQWAKAEIDLGNALKLEPSDEKCKSEYESVKRKMDELREKQLQHAKNAMQDPARQPKMAFTKVAIQHKSQALEFAKAKFIRAA